MERQARAHGVALLLPDDYLEEAAVHLIDAWRDYKPLLDTVEALQGSTNAYVSHYSYLHTAGKVSDFNTYLRTLGVREHILSSGTFPEQRRIVMQQLRSAFSRYDIAVQPLGRAPGNAFAIAQGEVRTVAAGLGRPRRTLLMQHDARAIVHLDNMVGELAPILCSWDRVLLEVQTRYTHAWLALDPTALAELLALSSSDSDVGRGVVSPGLWARDLLDDETTQAASIWDWLAREEKGALSDAALLLSAREFVEQYQLSHQQVRREVLADAWREWKADRAQG